jgi:hypothetical protein
METEAVAPMLSLPATALARRQPGVVGFGEWATKQGGEKRRSCAVGVRGNSPIGEGPSRGRCTGVEPVEPPWRPSQAGT